MKRHEMEYRDTHGCSFTWYLMHTIWELCANCCSWLLRDSRKETEWVCMHFGEELQRKLVSNYYVIKHEGFDSSACICCSRPLGFGNKDVWHACDTRCYVRSSWALCWSLLLACDGAAEVWFPENCLPWLLWSRLTAGWLDYSHSVLNCYVASSLELLVSRSTSIAPSSFILCCLHLLKSFYFCFFFSSNLWYCLTLPCLLPVGCSQQTREVSFTLGTGKLSQCLVSWENNEKMGGLSLLEPLLLKGSFLLFLNKNL